MTSNMPQTSTSTLKPGYILVGVILLAGYFWLTKPAQPLLGWEDDFQSARQQANDLQKPMLLAFYMEGCGPCQAMDRRVLPQDEVTQALKDFIPVRLDAMKERELANRYGVYGTPTFTVVQPDGQMVAKCSGYYSTEEFVAFIEGATARMAITQPKALPRPGDPSTTVP